MKLRAIRVFDVRRFGGEGVAIENISDGLNIFAVPNEAGKSTMFDALHALLFVRHTSKAKPIMSLKPYAGGSPWIVADVECERGRYRIEKKFLRGSFARILDIDRDREVARADEAQCWINQLIGAEHGGYGPTGLLWVRQGESSNLASGSEVRQAALGSIVEDEVSTLTGGRRMRKILNRCSERLGNLITPKGRPKPKEAYGEAIQRVDSLKGQLVDLRGQLARAQHNLDERQRKRREHAELADPLKQAEDEKLLAHARHAFKEAREHVEQIARVKMELDLEKLNQKNSISDKDSFTKECDEALERKRELKELERALPKLEVKRNRAVECETRARAAWQTAEKALREYESLLKQARVAQSAREAKQRHDELADNLKKAAGEKNAERKARADAEAIRIEPEDIDELDRLENELAQSEHAIQATSTTLRAKYEKGKERRLKLGGVVMEHDVDVQIDGASSIAINDVAILSIVPGSGEALDAAKRKLSEAEKRVAEKLAALGSENSTMARARLRTRNKLQRVAETCNAKINVLAPDGIDALATQVADLAAQLDVRIKSDLPDVATAEKARDACREREQSTRENLDAANGSTQSATNDLQKQRLRIEAAEQAAARALDRTVPEEGWPARQALHDKAVADTYAKVTPLIASLKELKEAPHDLKLAETTVIRLEEAKQNRETRIANLRKDIAVLDERLSSAANDGLAEKCSEVEGHLETARQRKQRYEAEVAALRRLQEALEAANAGVRERYLEPVNKELKPLLGLLYGGAQIEFNDDLAPERLTRNGVAENMEALSGGTREQIAILTRLAFAKLLAKSGPAPPIILDDALIFSDDDRIEKMFTALHAQTRDLQMLAFSCRQRAFETLGGTILELEHWAPN